MWILFLFKMWKNLRWKIIYQQYLEKYKQLLYEQIWLLFWDSNSMY